MRNHTPHALMAMCEVIEVRGPLLSLKCWDLDDKIFNNVFVGDNPEPSLEPGSVHLMNLEVRGGLWRIEFCSPAYEMVEFDENAAMDDEGNLIEEDKLNN